MIKNREHAFEKISRDMKNGNIPGAVLLCGKEEFLVNFYAGALINMFVSREARTLDLVILDRDHVNIDNIIDNLETVSLLSERKVVWLPDFIDSRGKLPPAFPERSRKLKDLTDYIKEKHDGSLLLITTDNQDDYEKENKLKRSAIYKAVSGVGTVYDFGFLDHHQLLGFINKRLKVSGKQYKRSLPDFIARQCGYGNKSIDYDLYTLNNDLKKLLAYCADSDEIRAEDAAEIITKSPENDIFAMFDSMAKKRRGDAFRLLNNLLQSGENEFRLLSVITSQLELMVVVREMKEEGMNLENIKKNLYKKEKIRSFRTEKSYSLGNRFTLRDMKRMLLLAYEVEVNIKSGLMPADLALEFFVACI